MDPCREVCELIEESARITIVHHWDSDGIASAAIIEKVYADRKALQFIVPRIGLYEASAVPLEEVKRFNPDMLLVLDYGLNREDLDLLEERLGIPIAVVDHHATKPRGKAFCNPVAIGCSESSYSATSYVLYRALCAEKADAEIRDLVALGIIGDLGWEGTLDLTKWIPGYCEPLELLRNTVALIDSCYRLGDYDSMHYVRRKLVKAGLRGVVGDVRLESKHRAVEGELRSLMGSLKPVEERGPLLVFRVETESYLTSLIGRELAKRFPDSVVVLVNKVKRLDTGYIYVRSLKHKLRGVLELLKTRGLDVGGKDMVFVVTCRSPKLDEEQEVLRALEVHLSKPSR